MSRIAVFWKNKKQGARKRTSIFQPKEGDLGPFFQILETQF